MRKLGISIGFPPEELGEKLRIVREAGFEVVFPEYSDRKTTAMKCDAALAAGLAIDNIHAPFDGINDINSIWAEGDAGDRLLTVLKDCIDCCADFGIQKSVFHVSRGAVQKLPPITEAGYARFSRLIDHAAAKGVTLAFENGKVLSYLAYILEQFGHLPEVGFCWDTGHELCFTDHLDFMPLFGRKLTCVHLQDNHAVFNGDEHLIPFDGAVDWEKAARYIKNSPYDGPIMLEVSQTYSLQKGYHGYEALTPAQYYQRAYAAAAKLRDMIENT